MNQKKAVPLQSFLKQIYDIHQRFPKKRVVVF